jgi:hypothetical protein
LVNRSNNIGISPTATWKTTSRSSTSMNHRRFWSTPSVHQAVDDTAPKVKKDDISRTIAEKHNFSMAEATRIMDTVTDTIIDVRFFIVNSLFDVRLL